MCVSNAEPDRGDARGGVVVGAGSFERADWTRASSFCILPISPRIWYREPDRGVSVVVHVMLGLDDLEGSGVRSMDGVDRPPAGMGMEGPRE